MANEDILSDDIVAEHLTRYIKFLLFNHTISFKKLFLNQTMFYIMELLGQTVKGSCVRS